jgi:S1-C subfamily serine protease
VALINAAGGAQVARAAAEMAAALSARDARLTYQAAPAPTPRGDVRGGGASLGTVPDYVGPADGTPGVLLAGVRAGSPAEAAGLRRGDILVGIDGRDVRDIEDFMYALSASKPGRKGMVAVLREGKRVEFEVTFGGPMRR